MALTIKALFLVVIAEMGDKTQLLAMAMASKYKASQVLMGVFIATILNHGLAVAIGAYLSSLIPMNIVRIVAAIAFLIFGLWTLRGDKIDDDDQNRIRLSPVITVAVAFFIAEMGDKTQLMTITISAQNNHPFYILLGTTIGMMISDGIGILGGAWIYRHLSEIYIKWGAGMIFILFGTITLYDSIPIWSINIKYILYYFLVLGLLVYAFGVKFSNTSKDKIYNTTPSNNKTLNRKIK
ncbi:TMEM165/GDT1 family protein [Clostridium sp. cel8]|jgi:Ca2+/H+ antiporter, TMEM165/GDT1 family|uniref:TMEM165/GDT1 family protein n=1 Tax=unclassified Clostridium TaxID=2614128 RepID=UPI0015F63EF1|nr:TMEM165/GDT1 family protein [Clostridium sp. cel8]MBA5851343.1 TMEM165/GDT1 family protein [Clostridium sp. cel8]